MNTSRDTAGGQPPFVFRATTGPWFAAVAALFVVLLVVADMSTDTMAQVLRRTPWYTAALVGAWAVLWRPRVEVREGGVTLVNPWRTVHVPWGALIAVHTRFALTLQTPTMKVTAWAAPGPGRHQAAAATRADVRALPRSARDGRGSVAIGDLPVAPSGIVAAEVRRRWQRLVEDGDPALDQAASPEATSRPHVTTLVALATLATLGVVTALI